MTKGVLIFAHNNREIDYVHLALISGKLAHKHLNVPVSLATDDSTIDWMKESNIYNECNDFFDNIIIINRPEYGNVRNLYDGVAASTVPFTNGNRFSVWDITPYERTLLIDSDFLIFSNNLSAYWDVKEDILIAEAYKDLVNESRVGYHDMYISDTGIKMFWATTVMFTKNQKTKVFFDLVEHIKNNYKLFSDVFRFDHTQYRNDVSFSIAKHILDGFQQSDGINLPKLNTFIDRDILYSVSNEGNLVFLVSEKLDDNFYATSIKGMDVHVMNKRSILRNATQLMDMK
jgi:hypothetical protein